MTSTETPSVEGRYGGNTLIDPWTKHGSLRKHTGQNIPEETPGWVGVGGGGGRIAPRRSANAPGESSEGSD